MKRGPYCDRHTVAIFWQILQNQTLIAHQARFYLIILTFLKFSETFLIFDFLEIVDSFGIIKLKMHIM
jgi:hypothetical protein